MLSVNFGLYIGEQIKLLPLLINDVKSTEYMKNDNARIKLQCIPSATDLSRKNRYRQLNC